ncbi:hypothetical protein Ae201684P_004235 [Aphanomyces euteiches]|uniref:EGF-like domain-containing protein n=1 Tax=Aphanomyces euteiches TaxID=100861 RepID=A0A6G0XD44_9STRA|nr:hypothetical protein Ae201684_006024 [Aphanomyces euteiches]KAH9068529.1 hypothetical protein Ae201684P_004235 [Aphanomyces euteiches]KAH9133964.1 hypothetical protein AeRB84_020131 [Aphanomyces euteiches]KAH9135425.1 hypothetical protein AeRB84_019174 [Aphanomyces euteiches]KAH9147547.1 hypothetical protein AeRB84_008869 [Aphanomyces euteiches]
MKSILTLGTTLGFVLATTMAHEQCGHEAVLDQFTTSIEQDSLIAPQALMEDPHHRQLSSQDAGASSTEVFKPLRIAFDLSKLYSDVMACFKAGDKIALDGSTYTCTADDVITQDKLDFITGVLLPAAQDYFSSILSVHPVERLKIPGTGCGNVNDWACCAGSYPALYKSPGITDADFLLHVSARPVQPGVIAWAIPCNTDQFGRPISAQANFGPQKLSSDPGRRSSQIATIIHELSHALGFSQSLFGSYRRPNNGLPWGANNVVQVTNGPNGSKVTRLITPKVRQVAREYFNCSEVIGGELQNSNLVSYSSHWAKRVFLNEYMMATTSNVPLYSNFTLAAFEDSGWYQVNYTRAHTLRYGHLAGCGLATGRCTDWKAPLCYSSQATDCTPDNTAKGICNIATLQSQVPAAFRYFDNPNIGGTDTYSDYCPRFVPLAGLDCRGIGSTPAARGSLLEAIGSTSLCFRGSLSKTTQPSPTASYCFAVQGCTADALQIAVGTTIVSCPFDAASVTVNVQDEKGARYTGSITCPSNPRDMCNVNKCSNLGVWTPYGCICNPGYTGANCSELQCPRDSQNQVCGNNGKCVSGACQCFANATGIICTRPIAFTKLVVTTIVDNKNPILAASGGLLLGFVAAAYIRKRRNVPAPPQKIKLQAATTPSYGTATNKVMPLNG